MADVGKHAGLCGQPLFNFLELLPAFADFIGSVTVYITEDVCMAEDQLADDGSCDVTDGELTDFLGNIGMEGNLQ